MPLQKVIPKPRWEFNTCAMNPDDINQLAMFGEKWCNGDNGYFYLGLDSLMRQKESGVSWATYVLDSLPDSALEEIKLGHAHLWIEIEYPED